MKVAQSLFSRTKEVVVEDGRIDTLNHMLSAIKEKAREYQKEKQELIEDVREQLLAYVEENQATDNGRFLDVAGVGTYCCYKVDGGFEVEYIPDMVDDIVDALVETDKCSHLNEEEEEEWI